MLDWQAVDSGRARAVTLIGDEKVIVRVGEDGTVHFFEGLETAEEMAAAAPAGGMSAYLERLHALDAIDIVCRSLGGDDPGPMSNV